MREPLRSACTAAVTMCLPSYALPQSTTTPTTDESTVIEEIIVTGSRIPRRDFFSMSPIATLDRQEIELTGDLQANYLLNSLPQVEPGLGAGTGNTFEGTSRINLRGLGDFRTLTLLNGRRFANSNAFGATDLNSLPPVMIERVEVITGGASAVYGSDAVAGAVNFILRNDFDGLEANVQYGLSERGDADTLDANVAFGTAFADGDGHVSAFLSAYDRSAVFQDARAFSETRLFANNRTGEIEDAASFYSGAGTIDGIPGVSLYTFDPDGSPRLFVDPDDSFNTSPENALISPLARNSAGLFGRLDITDDLSVSTELMYTRSEPTQRRDDVFVDFVSVNVDRPDIDPGLRSLLATDYDPDGDGVADFLFGRRFTVDRGPVINRSERDFFRAMLGFTGNLGSSWRWSADYSYTDTDWHNRTANDASKSRIQQGLLVDPLTGDCFDPSNGCVPVNPFGAGNLSAAASTFIGLEGSGFDETAVEQLVNVTLNGSPLNMAAGAVDVAIGVEYRDVDISQQPTEPLQSGDSVFWGTEFPKGVRLSVAEAYVEGLIPLAAGTAWAEYLGIELGARVSDYNAISDAIYSWKAGVEWQTVHGLRLRTMLQRAIRAPGSELFQENQAAGLFFGLGPFFDQCSASRDPAGNGLEALCTAQGIAADQIGVFEATFFPTAIEFGANPDLDAEEADTFTAGVVWQPEVGFPLSVSVDYFDIEFDNAITLVSPNDSLDLCFASRDAAGQFCQTFSREPGGNIAMAQARFFNAAAAKSEGVDFALATSWDAPALATIGSDASIAISVTATHYLTVGTRPTRLSPFFDCVGSFGALCGDFVFLGAMPEFRSNSRLTYASGPVSASLRWTHVDSMRNGENEFRELSGQQPGVPAVARLPSRNYFDLSIDAEIADGWNLTFGVVNLFDESPPFVGDGSRQSANTDPTTYDILGRRYFLRVGMSY